MSQRQNLSNKPETKRQFNAKNKYTSSSSSQNKSSKITTQQKTSQYKKIDNTLSNNDKILHHSIKRNFDKEGNAIVTTKIVREIGSERSENNLNSRSMINSKPNTRNISHGINNEQENKYIFYSNNSGNADEENPEIIYGENYEMYSPCSYNTQYKNIKKYSEFREKGFGGVPNLKTGQISPVMPNYVRSNEYIGKKTTNYKRSNKEYNMANNQNISMGYNNYNLESPYLSKYSPSNDFTSPDRQYDYNAKYFRNVQIEKIKGRQPMYNEKINLTNNQIESPMEYNGYPNRDEELYELVDNMATMIQSHVRGLLVRKKVLRFITLAIYYQSFCDKIQDVLCIHVRSEVFDILKNKIKNIKINNNYKYTNKNNYSNYSSNNNSNIRDYGKQINSSNSSYYKSYKTENNYKNSNDSFQTFKNPNINTNNYSTRKEVIQYSTHRNTPIKATQKDYSGLYQTNKITNVKNLKKNSSYQNNLYSNFNRSYNTFNQKKKTEKDKYRSPSASKVIHYFVNSPCTNKAPNQRYYHEINMKTTKIESHEKDHLNNHRSCHRCDEIRRMKKQEKFYITTTVEKREDEYEKYEYEKMMKFNQSSNDILTKQKNIENDNYLSLNILNLKDKEEKSKSMKDIFTNTTKDPNKISKVESINIKTTKRQKTEKEIEEEINRRVKITITEHEKIEKERRMKEESERKEKERIQKEKEKERERIQKEKEREREKERKEKEEKMKKERLERERKEKERRDEQIRIEREREKQIMREKLEKERKEKEERMKKEREERLIKEREERKRKEEQLKIEREKERERQKQLKQEQYRIEQEKRDKERIRKLQEEIAKQTIKKTVIKKTEEKKINMSDYILKKDCQKNIENMKSRLEKEYEKKIAMEKKKGLEEQKRNEEKIEIRNRKEIEKIMEQQKRKEIERQRELDKEKEMQKKKELELQKQREKEIQMGIKQEMEKQKEIMKQKELDEKNKKMKQIKINKVLEVNFKSQFPNSLSAKKLDEKIIEKNREKALKLLKKFILFRGNHLLKLKKYFNDWRINVKNINLEEFSKIIQNFCRINLNISSTKRAINNWKKIGRKIYYKRRIKLLKIRPKINIKKKKLYELLRITKLTKAFSIRRYIHYLILVWYIYAKNVHKKRVNMKFLYENLLRTYMSLAKDIFGNNQYENPSVQDAMYEAVNTNKFSTSYQDDVPLARKHYAEMRKKKLLEARNKTEYSLNTTKVEIEKKEMKKSYYSKEKASTEENENDMSMDEKRKRELLNKYRKYKSMNRELIWKKRNRYIASVEKNYSSEENDDDNDNRNAKNENKKESKNFRNINANDYKITKKIYEETKSYTKPVENKISSNYSGSNYNTNNYNTSNYISNNYNKVQGKKNIEIKEYKKVTEENKYNNTNYPSRQNKSENKDNAIKTKVYNNTNENKYKGIAKTSTQTTLKTTTQITSQKYSKVNNPNTTVNINVKSNGKYSNMSSNINDNIKKAPSSGYIKTEVTKTTYTKEESKPYITKNVVTKYETKGTNNAIKNNNVTIVSSNYQNKNDKDNNKSSNVNVYQSKYINNEGNNKEKKPESKNVTTKIERKVEIKTSAIADKDGQNGKKIFTTKSFTTTRTNK